MAKPERGDWQKVETRHLGKGMAEGSWLVTYEEWRKGIEHEHHIHLVDGTTITFSYETGEGGVTITEGR